MFITLTQKVTQSREVHMYLSLLPHKYNQILKKIKINDNNYSNL